MSNTDFHPFARICSSTLLVLGMGLLLIGSRSSTFAQQPLTGQGSSITRTAPPAGLRFEQAPGIHLAAVDTHANAQLAMGMLLVLAGFALHALMVVRHEKPMTSPRKNGRAPRKITRNNLDRTREYLEMFWVSKR